jgi:hypothetical protein
MLTSRVHSMSILEVPNGRHDVDHVAQCSCGWESLPLPTRLAAVMEQCEVMSAELDGARRRHVRNQLARTA